ncbi:MAG: hypothetical protein IJI20_06755 [Firmicutes bacterium]|nr:hypothetical protein [Bacillota bacterium]
MSEPYRRRNEKKLPPSIHDSMLIDSLFAVLCSIVLREAGPRRGNVPGRAKAIRLGNQ